MSGLANIFDTYERRARFYPVLLVLTPAVLGIASWLPLGTDVPSLAGSIILSLALAAFFSQLARDQGKKKEPELFRRWGGKPSVRALSYADKAFDQATIERLHRRIRELDPSLVLPASRGDEAADPAKACAAYESANELLLSRTQNRDQFRLVFEENVNYGYRRNLWAMKSAGVVTAALGVVGGGTRIGIVATDGQQLTVTAFCSAALGVTLLVLWLAYVRPRWVRLAADAYARQLVSAAQSL